MSLQTPELIRTLQRKLYLTAKAVRRHTVPSRGTRRFGSEAVFGKLGVLQLRRMHVAPRRVPWGEASRKAGWVLLHFAWIRQRGSCVFAGGRGRRGHSLGA